MSDPAGIATSNMADLLSAATLLLTVIGVVYGTWYGEITSVLAEPIPPQRVDREGIRSRVRGALKVKAQRLMLAAIVSTALFLPDALRIVFGWCLAVWTLGLSALSHYNAVKAAFVVVVVFTGGLAGYLVHLVLGLRARLREIDGPDR